MRGTPVPGCDGSHRLWSGKTRLRLFTSHSNYLITMRFAVFWESGVSAITEQILGQP